MCCLPLKSRVGIGGRLAVCVGWIVCVGRFVGGIIGGFVKLSSSCQVVFGLIFLETPVTFRLRNATFGGNSLYLPRNLYRSLETSVTFGLRNATFGGNSLYLPRKYQSLETPVTFGFQNATFGGNSL